MDFNTQTTPTLISKDGKSIKNYLTNFYPINLGFDEFTVLRIPNKEGLLQELRKKHNSTHSFFKIGDYVYTSNKEGEDLDFGGQVVTLSTFGDEKVTASLIKHIFFRTFKDRFKTIVPTQFYPFRIISRHRGDDIISDTLPKNLQDKIAFKKQIDLHLRLIDTNGKPTFGFVISIDRKWIFRINCETLNDEKFNLLGKEVLHSIELPGLSGILAPDESFIGIIKEIQDLHAIIETSEGDQQIPLNELFLRKTNKNIKDYLTYKLGKDVCAKILNVIKSKKVDIFNAKKIQSEIQVIGDLIASDKKTSQPIKYLNMDGFFFTISPNANLPHERYDINMNQTFIFNPSGVQTQQKYPDIGLKNFGPYDSNYFSPKEPNILAIFHKENRGFYTNFLDALVNGLPQSKYFKIGFKDKYRLHNIRLNPKEITSFEYQAYEKVVSKIEEIPDLAIIEIPATFKTLPIKENPYYLLKARLLAMEIPVQFITSYKAKNYDEYILNTLSLQIYAKLGGIPWVLPANQSIDKEIVIGIGHSIVRKESFKGNDQERVVGITTFFSGDGQYLLANRAKDVSFEEYFHELLISLKLSFADLSKAQAWKEGDTIRLIFHIFKPIKNIEFEVISKLVREFTQYSIQFAFVTISKKHPFLLFNPDEKGRRKYTNSPLKGEYVPTRGTNLVLNDSSCLIQLLGVNELKTSKHGMSTPLLIRIRLPEGNYDYQDIEPLLFTDLNYIVQQICDFTHLSWRTFLANEIPVTMQYSNLISSLLGRLRRISGWKPDSVNRRLKRKKWFL